MHWLRDTWYKAGIGMLLRVAAQHNLPKRGSSYLRKDRTPMLTTLHGA